MRKFLPIFLGILGVAFVVGGIIAIFHPVTRGHAAVIIAWGVILLAVVKVGIPESDGVTTRIQKHHSKTKQMKAENKAAEKAGRDEAES